MKKFRASIYLDVFIPDDILGTERQKIVARQEVQKIANKIPNSYIGGCVYLSGNLKEDAKSLEDI